MFVNYARAHNMDMVAHYHTAAWPELAQDRDKWRLGERAFVLEGLRKLKVPQTDVFPCQVPIRELINLSVD